ncbi:uncharacterized protein LOC131011961 [Salvia miltiorrhiza]|uniref:uncharacterized protein LOC131011961 n=1 Tax=Salvia miltiorrhiza TaxID=226208 RepID=UPI0025AD640A|nr:uncharacterized protein LOC131011961 [Salvia miltiorrhiza]
MAKSRKQSREKKKQEEYEKPHSWAAVRSLFTCKYLQVQHQQHLVHLQEPKPKEITNSSKKMKCSGSLCSNTKVMQKPEIISASPNKKRAAAHLSSSESDASSRSLIKAAASPSVRSMPFRKLSGCYECRMVVDPVLGMTRDPSLRATISSCPQCGQVFMKPENLELHQAVRHAVCELGAEDTSKNIVEIIFQSSWLKKQAPVCKIERILKVQNSPKTISKFEEYRDSIKGKANPKKQQPRCAADGNELLRFHCTTLMCSLGLNGSSNLCNSIPSCAVCSIIRNGFKLSSRGIFTTATSGKAHDGCRDDGKRAMLVCRVIAGRVNNNSDANLDDYDSVAGPLGLYSNFDELYVFNPKAILPCFVVIYTGFSS